MNILEAPVAPSPVGGFTWVDIAALAVSAGGLLINAALAYFVFRAQRALTARQVAVQLDDSRADRTQRLAEQTEQRIQAHADELSERVRLLKNSLRALLRLPDDVDTEERLDALAATCQRYGQVVELLNRRECSFYVAGVTQRVAELRNEVGTAILALHAVQSTAGPGGRAGDLGEEQIKGLLRLHDDVRRLLESDVLSDSLIRATKAQIAPLQ